MNDFILSDGTRLPVRVRMSNRAKRQRLSLAFTGQLEVVVPAHLVVRGPDDEQTMPTGIVPFDMSPASVAGFLEGHRAWIERAAGRTRQQRLAFEESQAAGLPKQLEFPLCYEVWKVEYKQTQVVGQVRVKAEGLRRLDGVRRVSAVRITGDVSDEELCCRALAHFVGRLAKGVLSSFAFEICEEMGAAPASIAVNNRKTAWGICTSKGDIRIDRRVMFLPREIARQVVLHEIAHLKHMNHSAAFYEELYSYPGSTAEAEKAIKGAQKYVPAWYLRGQKES